MEKLSREHFKTAKNAGRALNLAAKSMRILSSVAWDDWQKDRFLNLGKMPTPKYETIDVSKPRELIVQARQFIDGKHVVFEWLGRLADTLDRTTHLISTRGTPEFFHHSAELFGRPTRLMLDRKTRVIDLARHMDGTLDGLDFSKLVVEGYETHLTAPDFAKELEGKLARHFGNKAPAIELSDTLSAKAVAGRKRIRVRAHAHFTERDVEQLLQHEALIHTATALNGRDQPHFKILGRSHAGTTEIQEGLAVFAEIISGAMDPQRFRRLSDRVIAIQMSIDGADFKEVFDFYHDRIADKDQAFENTRRIFRGGVISGGAPFTKDMVYLNGLLRVHNFMRTGDEPILSVFSFAGKWIWRTCPPSRNSPARTACAVRNLCRPGRKICGSSSAIWRIPASSTKSKCRVFRPIMKRRWKTCRWYGTSRIEREVATICEPPWLSAM